MVEFQQDHKNRGMMHKCNENTEVSTKFSLCILIRWKDERGQYLRLCLEKGEFTVDNHDNIGALDLRLALELVKVRNKLVTLNFRWSIQN